jgi:hypothetical protein
MKRIGLAWRVIAWLICVAWIPVIVGGFLDSWFHLYDRGYNAILWGIPYIEFITIPLTFLAILMALYKAVKGVSALMGHDKKRL